MSFEGQMQHHSALKSSESLEAVVHEWKWNTTVQEGLNHLSARKSMFVEGAYSSATSCKEGFAHWPLMPLRCDRVTISWLLNVELIRT
eukprot:3892395-Amphidinium_carterae.1